MEVKIKKLVKEAVIPTYAKHGDAGMDLTATSRIFDKYGNVVYGTGLAVAIPEGHMGLLFPRSSNSKMDLLLCNSVGVIDSGYRGELLLKYKITTDSLPTIYQPGEKIGQLIIIPYPKIEPIEAEELSDSDRNEGGFGSTDK